MSRDKQAAGQCFSRKIRYSAFTCVISLTLALAQFSAEAATNIASAACDPASPSIACSEDRSGRDMQALANTAQLAIVKVATNDNGGTAVLSDFQISTSAATSTPLVFNDQTPDSILGDTTTYTSNSIIVEANTPYSLSEVDIAGYSEGSWSCSNDGGSGSGAYNAGSVTLVNGASVTCTITNDDIPAQLTIRKLVFNNDGGTGVLADFQVESSAASSTPLVFNDETPDSTVGKITTYTSNIMIVAANTPYTLSEIDTAGYSEGNWSCSNDGAAGSGAYNAGSVTLAQGESVICSIVNNDIATQLTLRKLATSDNGGTATVADFQIESSAASSTPLVFNDETPDSTTGDTTTYTSNTISVEANTPYTLTEIDFAGYDEGHWSCSNDGGSGSGTYDAGSVMLAEGESVICSISNNDIAPQLTLRKLATNDNGGVAVVDDFQIETSAASSTPLVFSDETADSTVGDTTTYTSNTISVDANTPYTLTEIDSAAYNEGDWSCSNDGGSGSGAYDAGSVTLTLGESVVCSIANDDIAPQLTIVKIATSDDGGTATVDDFQIESSAASSTALVFNDETPDDTAGDTTTYTSNAIVVDANIAYTMSEIDFAGYDEGDWHCSNDGGLGSGAYNAGSVTLAAGESVICSIANDDAAPQLTLIKQVINTSGGTAVASDFTLKANTAVFVSGVVQAVAVGSYDLSEINQPGYVASDWTCVGGTQDDADTVTLALGEQASCTIINQDIAPELTILKVVVNDDDGDKLPIHFDLYLSGGDYAGTIPRQSGDLMLVDANIAYTLSEDQLEGYRNTGIVCIDDESTVLDHPVTLALGQSATCTITNNDNGADDEPTFFIIPLPGGSAAVFSL